MATSGTAASGAEVAVRLARREDMPRIHALIVELATYEGVPDGPKLTAQDLITDGFECSPPWFFVLVAEMGGEIVGYAMVNRAYSSWERRALYIEDLYVIPAQRRSGIGMKLLTTLCEMAVKDDVCRIDWHVLADNPSARNFYDKLGARDLHETEGRLALRLDRHRIQAVAKQEL